MIDKFYLYALLALIVFWMLYTAYNGQVEEFAACACNGIDENLCMQCGNCTWEITADGTGRCIPYNDYYPGYYWWNPFSWNVWNNWNTLYPLYPTRSYNYPYSYGWPRRWPRRWSNRVVV